MLRMLPALRLPVRVFDLLLQLVRPGGGFLFSLGKLNAIGALEPVVEDGLTVALSVTELGRRAAAGID